ncbi:insulinase family protein [Marinomonas pollencensis]|nr:insulinase family protein [Marinomonas pollencensis]
MFNSKKPLFSRPALAAVMVLSTLIIWVLNLTAPDSPYPTPKIEKWQTHSGIPVIWLAQDKWANTNKLEVRFLFNTPSRLPELTDATLALLMADSLPLSTASINQRLAPLAAKVSSDYDYQSQTIALTLNSEPAYLMPTLTLISQWLTAPVFKARALDHWQRQFNQANHTQQTLEEHLFSVSSAPQQNTKVTQQTVSHYYQQLTQHTSAIFIIGGMSKQAQQSIKASLNTLSEHFAPAANDPSNLSAMTWQSAKLNKASQPSHLAFPKETQSILALNSLTSVKQWLSLQIWGADLINTLSHQGTLGYVRLNLTLSGKHPWLYWRAQHSQPVLATSTTNQDAKGVTARSMIDAASIPSVQDSAHFNALLDQLKNQLAQRTLSPSWWSHLAASVTQENGSLTLTQFANQYQNAIDTFNQDDYKNALNALFITSSYQEIQVY